MNFLLVTWWLSAGLAAASLLAMTSLIVIRARRLQMGRADSIRRQQLQKTIFDLASQPQLFLEMEGQFSRKDRRLMVELFDDLLQRIHGKHAEQFISLMRVMGIMEDCLKRLSSRASWWLRVEACSILGYFNDPRSKLALYRALQDPVIDVRVAVARSLVRLGAVRSVTELAHYLAPHEGLPSLPVMALFRSLGRSAIPELIELLDAETTLATKILAVDALGNAGDAAAVLPLLNLYIHPIQVLRVAVMRSLALLRDPRALPAVLLAMTDTDWEVRAQAAYCAGQIHALEAVPLLEKLLEDDYWWVRYHAAEALYKIGGDGLVALQVAFHWGESTAREMAGGLLHEKGVVV